MDPAEDNPFQAAIELQGAMLGRHDEELAATRHVVDSLAAQVTDLSQQLHRLRIEPSPPRLPEAPEPRVNNPPCYSGEQTECLSFLTQCEVVFSLQPATYARDRSRIAYVISLLKGRAREWGTAVWNTDAGCLAQYILFKEEMLRVFDRSVHGPEASRLLSSLRQGRRSVADFSVEFRTLSTSCGWNEPALVARFIEGLNADIKDEVLAREVPSRLDPLIDLALRVERRFELRRKTRHVETSLPSSPAAGSPSSVVPDTEPMQLGGIRLSAAERHRRISNRLCLYCGSDDHFASSCPLKARAHR